MNILLHFLLNYAIVDVLFGVAFDHLVLIVVFSVFLDLDHLPYLSRVKRTVVKKKFGAESRTRFHELYGLTIAAVLASIASLTGHLLIVQIAFLCYVLHLFLDFISGITRPFYPFSRMKVFIGLVPARYRIHAEVILTVLFGVIVWPSLKSLEYLLL